MNRYRVEANLILPFRSWLPPCEAAGKYFDDQWESKIALTYSQRSQVLTGVVDTTLCTIAVVSTYQEFSGDKENAGCWARSNAAAVIADVILPRLNYLFLQLKRSYPQTVLSGRLRNVGDIDVLFLTLFFEGEGIFVRGSSSISASLVPPPAFLMEGRRCPDGPVIVDPHSPRPLSKEWIAITRAVDLVNHGYFTEAVLVAFALLDAHVQDFVRDHIPNLKRNEATEFLRKVGTRRLETLLGSLLRICLDVSPLDDEQMRQEIEWLNKKRNGITHRGEECLRAESQRALRIVWRVLGYLSAKGANYSLPVDLEFYTPPAREALTLGTAELSST